MDRVALNRRLWGMVRHLPGGEETMRDMIGVMRQEDGSGAELAGTPEYTSVRQLSNLELEALCDRVEAQLGWGPRRRAKAGTTVHWMVSVRECAYIRYLGRSLGMDQAAIEEFSTRQIKKPGPRTHKEASALIEPMERMLEERGYTKREVKGRKWWDPPRQVDEGA
jgi:hypothetical protein